jgi:hypothetical protein
MKTEIIFPVFVCEVETQDITRISNINDLKLFVEEFFDILKDDFELWNAKGYRIEFNKEFLQEGETTACTGNKDESSLLLEKVIAFAKRKNINDKILRSGDINLVYDQVKS